MVMYLQSSNETKDLVAHCNTYTDDAHAKVLPVTNY
jgi:hypothetical protein